MEILDQTNGLLDGLKLSGAKAALKVRLKQAQDDPLSYETFLNTLLHDEKEHRKNARVARLLKKAAFRQNASLEGFDYSMPRGVSKQVVANLATGRFVLEGSNILISGPTGVGKSYMATAIGNHLCRLGRSVVFFRMNALIEKIHLERAKGNYLNLIKRLTSPDVIIIDDFGIKPLEPSEYQDFYDIIDERGEEKSIILTTQLPPENWNEIIPDPITCEAVTDRIVSQSIKIQMAGQTYRQKRQKAGSLEIPQNFDLT